MILFLSLACSPTDIESPTDSTSQSLRVNDLLLLAGTTTDEKERYSLLVEAQDLVSSSEDLSADFAALLPIVDQWANGKDKYWLPGEQQNAGEDGYLGGFFIFSVIPGQQDEALYPPAISPNSELYPLWCLYRGRMLIWAAIENAFLTDQFFAEGRECLQVAHNAYPENDVIGTYLGTATKWSEVDLSTGPAWASHQRFIVQQLQHILNFWIDERQTMDGQFGGGWGDDVEMWRWWAPLLIGFDVEKYKESQRLLATNVFALDRMAGGYTNIMTDVEHSAEDSGDTITPMLLLYPNDTEWQERAKTIANLMDSLWLAENNNQQQQFQSTYFTSSEVNDSANFACDTPYHSRAVQPAALLWQQSRDPEIGEIISRWIDGWLVATQLDADGKPAGVIPAAINFPTGRPIGSNTEWWNPGCHYTDKTFAWPRAISSLGRIMVATSWLMDDPRYLAALDGMAEMRRAYLQTGETGDTGSAEWAAANAGSFLRDALAKHWLLTGDEGYVDLLAIDGNSYTKFLLNNDTEPVLLDLERMTEALSVNEAFYTSEVRFTDRVIKFHSSYYNDFTEVEIPNLSTKTLYSMLTGDVTDPLYLPLPAVKWKTNPTDFAFWVTDATSSSFAATIYNFAEETRTATGELLRLEESTYTWQLTCPQETLSGTYTSGDIEFPVVAQQECYLSVTR